MKTFFKKTSVLFLLSLVFLCACGGPNENPEEVMSKFKQQIIELKSADFSADLSMKGGDENEAVDFMINGDFKFDHRDIQNKKMDMHIKTSGFMQNADKSMKADVDFNFLTIADQYYVRLSKLDSTDEGIAKLQPLLDKYIGKWLKISPDFIPENVRKMQEKDAETLAKEKQLKDLFVKTNLFNVVKEYGVETLSGQKVYHYGLEFNQKGVQDYIRQSAVIDGRELTEDEITEAAKVATYLKDAQIWIDIETYYPAKLTLSVDSEAFASEVPPEEQVDMNIDLVLEGSGYNGEINITAPTDAEEFNPMELVMGYSMMNMAQGDEGEPMSEEEMEAMMKMMEEGTMEEGSASEAVTGESDEDILEDFAMDEEEMSDE